MMYGWLQAVMLYHLQKYAAAMSVLEPLFRNIEPIDEACVPSFTFYPLCLHVSSLVEGVFGSSNYLGMK